MSDAVDAYKTLFWVLLGEIIIWFILVGWNRLILVKKVNWNISEFMKDPITATKELEDGKEKRIAFAMSHLELQFGMVAFCFLTAAININFDDGTGGVSDDGKTASALAIAHLILTVIHVVVYILGMGVMRSLFYALKFLAAFILLITGIDAI